MGVKDKVDVAILCGGFGTRVKDELNGKPKPMVDIDGRPFLEILVSNLKRFNFSRFVFCSGYRGEQIEEYFGGKGGYYFSHESLPLGTAGAIKFAEPHFLNKNILVLNGDSFCTINYSDFVDFHLSNDALLSVVVAPVEGRDDGGCVSVDNKGRVLSFVEKGGASNFINAGVYLLRRDFLDRIPVGKNCSLEYDIFPALDPGVSFAYSTKERLFDIGTPERLREFRDACKFNSLLTNCFCKGSDPLFYKGV